MNPENATPFELAPVQPSFEDLGHNNGFRYWWASDLAKLLGYEDARLFRKAVERAMITLTTLAVPIYENVVQVQRQEGGKAFDDFKLSRFACYLAAMNGDPRKPEVAAAQGYFATWASACQLCLENSENVERVAIRSELSDHEKTLSSTAQAAGVQNFAFFQNAGYRGLYNMNLNEVRTLKGVPAGRSPLDFMGKTELAANLFRVTQTEEKIRAERIRGQVSLEGAAHAVGKKVRNTMIEISGRKPEQLPAAKDIKDVQKGLKSSHRQIRKIDGGKK